MSKSSRAAYDTLKNSKSIKFGDFEVDQNWKINSGYGGTGGTLAFNPNNPTQNFLLGRGDARTNQLMEYLTLDGRKADVSDLSSFGTAFSTTPLATSEEKPLYDKTYDAAVANPINPGSGVKAFSSEREAQQQVAKSRVKTQLAGTPEMAKFGSAGGLQFSTAQSAQEGMTREQIAERAKPITLKPGETSGGTRLNLPQPEYGTGIASADQVVAGTTATGGSLDAYLKKLETPKSALDSQNEALVGRLGQLYGQNVGRAEAQARAEEKAGLSIAEKELQKVNNQIKIRAAEYEKLSVNAQGQTIPLEAMVGQQLQVRLQAAAEMGLLSARAQALQGDIVLATNTAAKAVDLQFKKIEEEITARERQLALIAPQLDREQAKVAQAQAMMLADEKEAIAELKAKQKTNIELAFSAGITTRFTNKGGEFFRASDGKPYESAEEFFADAGVSSFEEAYARGLVTDLDAQRLADMDFVLKLRETYPDAGIGFGDDAQSAVDKLSYSNKYARENASESSELKPTTINGQDYFLDPVTGTYVPATDFVEGGNPMASAKYVDETGQKLKLTATQAETLSAFDSTAQMASQALALVNEGLSTGPGSVAKNRWNKLFNKADPKTLEFEQKVGMIKADFQKAISGATVSEQERKRLEAFLPSLGDQEGVTKSKLQNLITEMQNKKGFLLDSMGGQQNPSFSSAGTASSANQLKGTSQTQQKMQPYVSPNAKSIATVVTSKYKPGSTPITYGAKSNECGYYARNVIESMGMTYPALGDGLNSKKAAVQKYGTSAQNAQVGSIVVTEENPTYGHVAVVLQKTPQGVIVTESNFKQAGRISHGRLIPYNKIVGAINPTKK